MALERSPEFLSPVALLLSIVESYEQYNKHEASQIILINQFIIILNLDQWIRVQFKALGPECNIRSNYVNLFLI